MPPILSIYIPTFNRKNMLKQLIYTLPDAVGNYRDKVEIVISDNASEDGTDIEIAEICRKLYGQNTLNIRYHRNSDNIGSCPNFLQADELTNGEFCWILGDDDFILPDGISKVIDTIEQHSDIDYILANYLEFPTRVRAEVLSDIEKWRQAEIIGKNCEPFVMDADNRMLECWEHIYTLHTQHPSRMATHLGMNIFRKEIWREGKKCINLTKNALIGKNIYEEYKLTLDWVFPHIKLLSSELIGKSVYYIGQPVYAAGIGSQENSEDNWAFIDTVVLEEAWQWLYMHKADAEALRIFQEDHLQLSGEWSVNILANQSEDLLKCAKVSELFKCYGNNPLFYETLLKTLSKQLIPYNQKRYIDYSGRYFANKIQTYADSGLKLAIWGAGELCASLLKCCDGLTNDNFTVVDSNPCLQGKNIGRYAVNAPEYLRQYCPDVIIVASDKWAEEICMQIEDMEIHCDIVRI